MLFLGAGLFVSACGDDASPTTPPSMTEPEAPRIPTGLQVSATGATWVEWRWNAVAGASGYDVQFSTDESFTGDDEIIPRMPHELTYRREDLEPRTSSSLRVRSAAGTGASRSVSDWSTHIRGTTTMMAPRLPPLDTTPPPEDPTPVEPDEVQCHDWADWVDGPYRYLNNVWNKGTIAGYEQCLMTRTVAGRRQYGWRWAWPSQHSAASTVLSGLRRPNPSYHVPGHEVRAYPEIIFGQHPFAGFSTTQDLPIRIADIRALRVDFEAYVEVEGDYNLAFDIWITRELPPTPGPNTTHEIMIWLDRSDWYPSGADNLVAEAQIDGSDYSVFVHQTETDDGRTWRYVAFAAHVDQYSGTVHLDQFLKWLVENEHLADDHFVAVVELGNEVLDGSSGELWLADFTVTAR